MNDYIDLRVNASPCNEDMTDLLAALFAEVGYDSFTSDDNGMNAFILKDLYDEDAVKSILNDFPMDTTLSFKTNIVVGEDWNAEWERNYFKPIIIGNDCVIHSTFHKDIPKATYDIVIDPKMAFGTGHHSTTRLMLEHLLKTDMVGKNVIDMGTGTGILAILCKMKGANNAYGIEIDPGALENAKENAQLNNVEVSFIGGDVKSLTELSEADIFIANINRNIILADLSEYAKKLKATGKMLLSGFYEKDVDMIKRCADLYGLKYINSHSIDDWTIVELTR
jgi:ribosomal protein L11 methyltransferase